MIDLRLSQMEPTDLRGIPFYNKDSVGILCCPLAPEPQGLLR